MITVTELLQPVETDLETLLGDLRNLIGAGHPILQAAAEHLFSAGGKRIRPGIVLLISRALAADGELTPRHRRLAEITEMIHTASLVHDDVVDEASTRRVWTPFTVASMPALLFLLVIFFSHRRVGTLPTLMISMSSNY
jgi:all-trans-nonaprenyl-diphosphate synthase